MYTEEDIDSESGFDSSWYGVDDGVREGLETMVEELPDDDILVITGEVTYDYVAVHVYYDAPHPRFEDSPRHESWAVTPDDRPVGGSRYDVGDEWEVRHKYGSADQPETVVETSEIVDELRRRIRAVVDEG